MRVQLISMLLCVSLTSCGKHTNISMPEAAEQKNISCADGFSYFEISGQKVKIAKDVAHPNSADMDGQSGDHCAGNPWKTSAITIFHPGKVHPKLSEISVINLYAERSMIQFLELNIKRIIALRSAGLCTDDAGSILMECNTDGGATLYFSSDSWQGINPQDLKKDVWIASCGDNPLAPDGCEVKYPLRGVGVSYRFERPQVLRVFRADNTVRKWVSEIVYN